MQDRTQKSPAVVDFDFDESGNIVKAGVERPKISIKTKTLDEIRQRVLSMGPRPPQRNGFWSRIA